MPEFKIDIELNVEHDFSELERDLNRIQREADLSQTVLEGIQAIQWHQRREAPKGRGNIPRSIRPARVRRSGNHEWSADSTTNYGPAVFTNEGTGLHGPKGSRYPITQYRTYKSGPRAGTEYVVNISHPGIRGTHWWERGADKGAPLALEIFKRKIDRMLGTRSGRG